MKRSFVIAGNCFFNGMEQMHRPIRFLFGNDIGLFDWDADINKAIRFCRKEDANMVAGVIGGDAEQIIEHEFEE